jgi:hypothetical protein
MTLSGHAQLYRLSVVIGRYSDIARNTGTPEDFLAGIDQFIGPGIAAAE